MNTGKSTIGEIFRMSIRYVVPLFQRGYVWSEEQQWQPLWEDLLEQAAEVARHRSLPGGPTVQRHFLGAVVLNQVTTTFGDVPMVEIIDGQQRLTTLQILLAAIRDETGDVSDEFLRSQLVKLTQNDGPLKDPDQRFKVWPTSGMQDDIRNVIEAGSAAEVEVRYSLPPYKFRWGRWEPPRPGVVDAYLFFGKRVREFLDDNPEELPLDLLNLSAKDRVAFLIEALVAGFQLVTITLDREDDAQVIFETLNARGEALSPSDLVRNFVFLTATREHADVEALYMDHWRSFEEAPPGERPFWKQAERQGRLKRSRMDLFLFHYVIFRAPSEIKVERLYEAFRKWWESAPRSIERELAELQRYSAIYRKLLDPLGDTPFELFAHRLRVLDSTSVYPLVLWAAGALGTSGNEFEGIIKDLESYFVRRAVCGYGTKSYTRFFVEALRRMRARDEVPSRGAIRDLLTSSQAESAVWPSDEEFTQHLTYDSMYWSLKQRRTLMLLEALDRAERSRFGAATTITSPLTVEHVLPQHPRPHEWPLEIFGEEDESSALARRERFTHSLGNLTLLTQPHNSFVSNAPYATKRPEITLYSMIALNNHFQNVLEWNEAAIEERGRKLAKLALTVWPGP